MLLLLEAVIAQADRVLDDVVGAALVLRLVDAEVATPQQANLLAAFGFGGMFVGFHCRPDLLASSATIAGATTVARTQAILYCSITIVTGRPGVSSPSGFCTSTPTRTWRPELTWLSNS